MPERFRKICTLLIGQNHFDQLETCKSDLKTTWRQHYDSTAKSALLMDVKLYKWLLGMVQQCALFPGETVHFSGRGFSLWKEQAHTGKQ